MSKIKGINILVVDDDPLMREVLSDELTLRGAKVNQAANGTEALTMITSCSFDVVISDARMPGGDGITLFKGVQKMEKSPKLFLCSGFNDISEVDAKAYKILCRFCKPFRIEELIIGIEANI